MSEANPWKIKTQQVGYESPWIQVRHHEVIDPSGNDGIYGYVHFKNVALGVIPIDDQDHTYLVGQYRFPNNEYTWEIPEGGGNPTADPIDEIARELKEETGLIASDYSHLLEMRLSNSATDEIARVYVARDLRKGDSAPESTEQLQVKRLPVDEAIAMAMDGRIIDSMSVAGLLKLKILRDSNTL